MEKVKLNQAILEFIENTDDIDARQIMVLEKWAKKCEKAIGSYFGYRPKSFLSVVDKNEIPLPDDCAKLIDVFYGDQTDKLLDIFFRNLEDPLIRESEIGVDLFLWSSLEAYLVAKILWQVHGNVIIVDSEFDEEQVTLAYLAYDTDEHNNIIINESHIDAIWKYLKHMVAERDTWKIFRSENKLLRQSHLEYIKHLKFERNMAIRNARAIDGEPGSRERLYL